LVFVPRRIFFEERALEYDLGIELYHRLARGWLPEGAARVEVGVLPSRGRIPRCDAPGEAGTEDWTPEQRAYVGAKRTLVFAVRRKAPFATCRPSADYQLPLVSSCPGLCEYCYLQTTLGVRPYVRAYVNVDEILGWADEYIRGRAPRVTVFEGSATSDPVPVEPYTGALAKAIEFFGKRDFARFRFATKFTDVRSLLRADHRGHTRVRFSVNAVRVIETYERGTPGLSARVEAARMMAAAGYPIGFLIAPVFVDADWRHAYLDMLDSIAGAVDSLRSGEPMTFEVITHRFTPRARSLILARRPHSRLPMEAEGRKRRMGQFGYIKYVYGKDILLEVEEFFRREVASRFPRAVIEYVI